MQFEMPRGPAPSSLGCSPGRAGNRGGATGRGDRKLRAEKDPGAMSREHQNDQAAQQDTSRQPEEQADKSYGLPSFLYERVLTMGPEQAEDLAKLLRQFPAWRQQLCAAATEQMTGRVVRQAVDLAVAGDKTDKAADASKSSIEEIWAQHFDYQQQVASMGPDDGDKLAEMIRRLPHFRVQILRMAEQTMGEASVMEAISTAASADRARDRKQDAALAAKQEANAGKSQQDKDKEAAQAKEDEKKTAADDRAESEQYKKDRAASQWLQDHHPDTLNQLSLMGPDVDNVAYMLTYFDDQTREHIRHIVTVRYGESFTARVESQQLANRGLGKPIDVAGARKYNLGHQHQVSKFLDALKDNGFLAESGEIDPIKVAVFQKTQGIDIDGKVGNHTVAAAQHFTDSHPLLEGLE